MKKILGIIFISLLVHSSALLAQVCEGVSAEAFPMNPQTGLYNYFGVRVTLEQVYSQDVTVTGYIYTAGSPNQNNPYTLTITAGNLSEETGAGFYATSPADNAAVDISTVNPCPFFYYTNEFLNSSYFDTLIAAVAQYSMNIKGQLLQTGGTTLSNGFWEFLQTPGGVDSTDFSNFYLQNSLDDTLMRDFQCVILAAYLKFYDIYSDFFSTLSVNEQDQVFSNVFNTLKDETFISNNPNNILVQRIESILERDNDENAQIKNNFMPYYAVSMAGTSFGLSSYKYKLTWDEVVDCVGDAIGGAVFAGIVTAASTIWGLVTGGGSIRNIAKMAGRVLGNVAKSLPWGAIVGFSWCLISNSFDWSFSSIF